MARWIEPSPEQEAGYKAWTASRPPVVRALAERFPPWELFALKPTSHRVTVYSFNEDGTLTVEIKSEFNEFLLFERQVFGIKPEDLEPCDVPTVAEPIVLLSQDEVANNIDSLRTMVRPDLWAMGKDGKAHLKQKR